MMSKVKVLLVDDEVEFASTLAERLQIRGYEAKAVFCAESALDMVRSEPPDVVLLDLKMPGMNGVEVLRTIKKLSPSCQVILLTGHGSEQSAAEWAADGAADYAIKPSEIETLVAKIDRANEKRLK
jgi:DNA-binding NtrC family response regulator